MNSYEYESLQERFSNLLNKSGYLSGNKSEAYQKGVLAAKSVLHEIYNRQNTGTVTNGDRLRAMTNKQLAAIMDQRMLKCVNCPVYHTAFCTEMTCIGCAEKIEKWLNQEVSESVQNNG